MRNRFDEQLEQLNVGLIKMGALCEESIACAVKALFDEKTSEMITKVNDNEEETDHMEHDIEALCMKLLLHQQPVAKDLRCVSSALKMISDMERIGDQAADIGEITIKLANQPYIKKLEHINQMASETMLMLIRSIEAYVEKDMGKARKVIAYDDVVDDLFEKVRDDLIAMIQADSANGEQAADLLMVAKYFERIGDHATNIAEWVIFALDTKGGFDENASEHL